MKKRILLASTVALSFAPVLATQAEEVAWTARSVEQIQNDVTKSENKTSYTIQYGDTLSTIAEALGVDVTVLANLNKISNIDLIFPETVLTTTVNDEEEVTEVEIHTPDTVQGGEGTTATADLTTNQVTVDNQTVQVEDLTQPVEETEAQIEAVAPQVTEEAVAEATTEAVTEVVAPVEESVVEATTEVATPAEGSAAETTTGTVAEVSAPVEEPVAEATTETVAETPVVEETTTTEAPVTETVTETQSAPSTYQAEASQGSSATYAAPAAPDYASIAASKSENAGLQPQTAAFKEEVANLFGITSFSGYRPGDSGDHGKGLAIDFMVPVSSALGDQKIGRAHV